MPLVVIRQMIFPLLLEVSEGSTSSLLVPNLLFDRSVILASIAYHAQLLSSPALEYRTLWQNAHLCKGRAWWLARHCLLHSLHES